MLNLVSLTFRPCTNHCFLARPKRHFFCQTGQLEVPSTNYIGARSRAASRSLPWNVNQRPHSETVHPNKPPSSWITGVVMGHWPNELSVRQWSGRPGFNLRSSHTKDLKMGLDVALLNTHHYKSRIKGKVDQSWEWSSAFPYTSMWLLLKRGPSGHPRLRSPTLLINNCGNGIRFPSHLSWTWRFRWMRIHSFIDEKCVSGFL